MRRLRATAIALGLGIFNLVGCTDRPTAPPVAARPSLKAGVSATTPSGYLQVSAGFLHTCAVSAIGSLACWGENSYDQTRPPSGTGFAEVGGGGWFYDCALKTDGSLACWGMNAYDQVIPPTGTGFVQLSTGWSHSCALRSDGSLACWGSSLHGETTPPADTRFVQVSAEAEYTCAVKTDGSLACWGNNDRGKATPPTGTGFVQVSVGGTQACALRTDGSLACWGNNDDGEATPPEGTDFVQVSAGAEYNCALRSGGSLTCWGLNSYGQATPPLGPDFVQVSAGYWHTCALRMDGSVTCWGLNDKNELTPLFVVTPPAAAEGEVISFNASNVTCSFPNTEPTYAWDFGDGISGTGMNSNHLYPDEGLYQTTLTVTCDFGLMESGTTISVPVANVAPVLGSVTGFADPVALGTSAIVMGSFTDAGIFDTHVGTVDWGDNATSPALITEASGSGSFEGSHVYTSAGTYAVTVTLSDNVGGTTTGHFQYNVVETPRGGFGTGGGNIESPAGAYPADPTLSGLASFTFLARYATGATVPTGSANLRFRYRRTSFQFLSTIYEWYAVAGPKGQLKGEGTVNGAPGYAFLLTAIDGDQPDGGGVDRFRIKIWEVTSGTVLYDNQLGQPNNSDAATPVQGGQIQVHQ